MVLIRGIGNINNSIQQNSYVPIPTQNENTINLITKTTAFKMTSPSRYVVDIPNAILINPSRIYKLQNSSSIQTIQMSQFSVNPNIVRVVFNTTDENALVNFKTYTNGSDIIVKYKNQIIDNSIQYKFYTPYSSDISRLSIHAAHRDSFRFE